MVEFYHRWLNFATKKLKKSPCEGCDSLHRGFFGFLGQVQRRGGCPATLPRQVGAYNAKIVHAIAAIIGNEDVQ